MEALKRKGMRLSNYNYSASGAYFITICTQGRHTILSDIVLPLATDEPVGDGALDVPRVQLTPIGKIVESNLLSSEKISGVIIDKYVIMPDHIHVIIFLYPEKFKKSQSGTSKAPSPTNSMIPHIIATFKRFCGKEIGENIFQRSYSDHIIRDFDDYQIRCKYIQDNPAKWYYNKEQNN